MRRVVVALFLIGPWLIAARTLLAEKPTSGPGEKPVASEPQAPPGDWVARLAERARSSVVVISVTGRDGSREGIGTGFVISSDGLIATNRHVIGDARPINVRSAAGKAYEVVAVEATDRLLDLAVLRINGHDLPALELGDSEQIRQGQPVVALGNPHGLEHSVVSGVISGSREIDGLPLLQLAIPIEPGNSGGPLLDERGRVLGLLTMKSAVTANLGFAVRINALKPLIAKPNPVPMNRWLTIGALDPDQWLTLFGAQWRQHAGRISVSGLGQGFGGRSLCLSKRAVPELPFEVSVEVKLDDDEGAAGLVFAADGQDRHYGFYPSAGHLRFSRFDGPDVFQWQVLREETSKYLWPGDWNLLKVRLDKQSIRCWLNDQSVIDETIDELPVGSVGLAKFRQTKAEFKHFRVAKQLPRLSAEPATLARIEQAIEKAPKTAEDSNRLVDKLVEEHAEASTEALRSRATQLRQQAKDLEHLAAIVYRRDTLRQFAECLSGSDEKINLVRAALLIARLDNEEVDVAAYEGEVDRLAADVRRALPKDASSAERLKGLNRYLFTENGFHGGRHDYYNRSNSYLNEVLDDREGLPITLSLLYMELARRLNLTVEGVALPGHFVVRYVPEKGDPQLLDVFEGAAPLSREQAAEKVKDIAGLALEDEHLKPVTKRAIIERMLRNLLSAANKENDPEGLLRYLDALVAMNPDAAEERLMRAVLLFRSGRPADALGDADWLVEHQPAGIDAERVEQLRDAIVRAAAKAQ